MSPRKFNFMISSSLGVVRRAILYQVCFSAFALMRRGSFREWPSRIFGPTERLVLSATVTVLPLREPLGYKFKIPALTAMAECRSLPSTSLRFEANRAPWPPAFVLVRSP